MGKTIFVTGANGFIGSHLVKKLLQRGFEVLCLVREPDKATALKAEGVRFAKGDITSRASMRDVMRGAEAVFHLAGWYAVGVQDTQRMYSINVDGARNVLELAAELGIPKILHTSSVGVFGNTHGKLVDESYRAPKEATVSSYELTKWQAHYEVAEPLQRRGAPLTILQPGFVTGAGDQAPHMMLFNMFLRKTPVMLGGKSGLTLAHVDDVAEGHVLALERGKPGEAYIIAGQALTYRQLFEMCERVMGMRAARIWPPGWAAAGLSRVLGVTERLGLRLAVSEEALAAMNDYTYWASPMKAERELGWRCRPTEETLKETLSYLQVSQ